VAAGTHRRPGLEETAVFAVEPRAAGGSLAHREAEQRGSLAARAAGRPGGDPWRFRATRGQPLVFDRSGGRRLTRRDRQRLDPRTPVQAADPVRVDKPNIAAAADMA